MSFPKPTQCSNFTCTTFAKDLRVSKKLFVDTICPYTAGGKVTIEALDLAFDCLTLTTAHTLVGCGANGVDGPRNTSVGVNALSLATGNDNTTLGFESAKNLTTGSRNFVAGSFTGTSMESATGNVILGESAGFAMTTGLNNTLVGLEAGVGLVDGLQNTIVGANSGGALVDGTSNVIIGNIAGSSTSTDLSSSVLIGNSAGANNTVNNRLMIDSSNTNEPLLDGSFSANTLQVNGVVTLGEASNTTNQHAVNGDVDPAAGTVNEYLVVLINGNLRKIPLHDIV